MRLTGIGRPIEPNVQPPRRSAQAVLAMRSDRACRLAMVYSRFFAARHFHAVRLLKGSAAALPPGPLLIYANHPSWWDPLLFALLTGSVLGGRPGWGPMDTAALGRYGVMRRLGIFGIDPATTSGARLFLQTGRAALDRPNGIFWVTAQGRFTDPRARPLVLRPGIAHLARRTGAGAVVPLAIEYPFWDERTPEALTAFGSPIPFDAGRPVDAWETLLLAGLGDTMDRLAEAAVGRDASRFSTLLAGRAGVGGVYDLWRRARAAWRGEPARLAHGEP